MISDDDEKFVEQLYEEYHSLMLYVAFDILKDRALAEDVVSEAFIKVIRHLQKLKGFACHQTKKYIVSIVETTSLDFLKKRKSVKEDLEELLDISIGSDINILDDLVSREGYDSLMSVIQSLPKNLKDVAYLYFACNHSHEDIARTLGISYDNSKKRLSRAREMIKKIWAGERDGEKHGS